MKTKALFCLAFAPLVVSSVFAQDKGPTLPTTVASVEHKQKDLPKLPLVTLDFQGGTLEELVALFRKNNTPMNLIADKPVADVSIPPFSIRDVAPEAMADVLHALLEQRGLLLSGGNVHVQGATPVFFVGRNPASPMSGYFAPYQLWPQLEYQSIDDIVGAIRAAWELDPSHNPADLKLKFHPATSLLLVAGPNDSIQIVTRVIGSLKGAPGQTTPQKTKETSPKP